MLVISCKKEGIKKLSLKDDVSILASDAFEGRDKGTDGERKAAVHISKRFKAIGLLPKGTMLFF
ncbi:MAG: hypothetical protein ABI263_04910 [Gelidibacter sp.]